MEILVDADACPVIAQVENDAIQVIYWSQSIQE